MAGALVLMVMKKLGVALASKVMNKLGEEVYLVGGAKAELERLSSTFESIEAILNHAEIMQINNPNMQVWLKNLKDVAYDVEDLLDEMIPWLESESRTDDSNRRHIGNQAWLWLSSLFSCCGLEDWISMVHASWTDGVENDNPSTGDKVWNSWKIFPIFFNKVLSRRNFGRQIKELLAKLDGIAAEKTKYEFKENYGSPQGSELQKADFKTGSLVDESKMLGRDRDKNTIISKLVSGSSSEEGRIHVISIVGVGGLGKTTLAQLICNDKRVISHFHKVLWVCVSDDFNVINLTKAIIQDVEGVNTPLTELNSLQNKLFQTLGDKLFLLVLDDVWNDDGEKWEKLRLSLESGASGSKILVTTRSDKVAGVMAASYVHNLEGLSYDDCLSLFRSKAFTAREMEDCRELEKMEEIGREIVKKCNGVPLSAKVIGSAMCSKTTAQDWQDILESKTWEIPDIAEGILPALLVSYYNLPVHLKQCFAYCSIFLKDNVLKKDKLVQLWLAQGFIKPQGRREMEAIGREYFDDLLARSLFQDVKRKVEVRCKMHDLLHDLAQFITKDECCIFENGESDSRSVTARHSSFIATWKTSSIPAHLCDAKKLRTLLLIRSSVIDTIPDNLFRCPRSLRTLDSGGWYHTKIKELPKIN